MPEDERLVEIIGAWHEARDAGKLVDPADVIAVHPDLADQLRGHFEVLGVLDQALRPAPALPATIGPYRILREIGAGGMGTVYLAEALRPTDCCDAGAQVALKTVHPHLLKAPGYFKRFQREAELGQQVEHPNLVRTLDFDVGVVDEMAVCYLVMEYVRGKTLRTLLHERGPMPEPMLRHLARHIATGLVAIHDHGIVHRDLKPDNVLITAEHEVRIMDLGIARLPESSLVLTGQGQFTGSLPYAAPEQLRQSEVRPAGDLYALGVLLHELATGHNPFRRDDAGAIMHAHLEETAPRLDEVDPDLSPFLAEVVATLLAKVPAERFPTAAALENVLREGERSAWWDARRALRRPRIPRIPVRRETALHGRESELLLLRDAWRRARKGQGSTLLLTGEAGIGKTRLMDAFLRDLDARDAHVLYGSYAPPTGRGGLSDAVLGKFGEADLEKSLRPYLAGMPALLPAFAAAVKHEQPPVIVQELAADAPHAVFCQLLRGLAAEKPVLWIVEDLHFAAADSRRMLLSLARIVERHRALLLLTTRPGMPAEEVGHFAGLPTCERATLDRLGARDVVLLLRDALGSERLADKLSARIAVKSDGIPFFIFEMIRDLKEEQLLERLPDGSYVESAEIEEIHVPSTVRELIARRLRDLGKTDRAVLDVAAVMGFEFDPGLVADVLGRPPVAVLQDLADIERRSGIVKGARTAFRFDHHQIQEVVYGDLHERLRAEYHTALAEAYAGRAEAAHLPDDTPVFLAFHHLRGIRPVSALPYLEPALARLADGFRHEEAVALADRALGTPGLLTGEQRLAMLLRQDEQLDFLGRRDLQHAVLDEADSLATSEVDRVLQLGVLRRRAALVHNLGRYDQALEQYERCLASARAIGRRDTEVWAAARIGSVLRCLGRHEEARRRIDHALELAGEIGDRTGAAAATGQLGIVLFDRGQHTEALACFERQIEICRENADRRGEATALRYLGVMLGIVGNHEQARRCFEAQLALSRELGDRRGQSWAHGNLGKLMGAVRSPDQAHGHLEQQLLLSREIGDVHGEADASGSLGWCLRDLGRLGEARDNIERHLTLAREIGERQMEAVALCYLGRLMCDLGATSEADAALREGLERCREIKAAATEGHALCSLGHLASLRGDFDTAISRTKQAIGLRRSIGDELGVAQALAQLGRLLTARGQPEAAADALVEARDLARRLGEPQMPVLASAHLGQLAGHAAPSVGEVEQAAAGIGHIASMETWFLLWKATGNVAGLRESRRLLDELVDRAPETFRESMLTNVPLHRDIMKAWEEHGEKGA